MQFEVSFCAIREKKCVWILLHSVINWNLHESSHSTNVPIQTHIFTEMLDIWYELFKIIFMRFSFRCVV